MKILLTGSDGQLGKALIRSCPKNFQLIPTNRFSLDLSRKSDCFDAIKNLKPDWVLNCGAYTSVDNAEKEKDLAMAVNYQAPLHFAHALRKSSFFPLKANKFRIKHTSVRRTKTNLRSIFRQDSPF